MTDYGVNTNGFTRKTFAEIRADIESNVRAKPAFGQKISLTEYDPLGQVVGVMTDQFDQLWTLFEALFNGLWAHSAEGFALDAVCQLLGIFRLQPTKTVVVAQLEGDPNETIPAGRLAMTDDTNDVYELQSDVPLGPDGKGSGTFLAQEAGRKQCLAGRLSLIVTPHVFWDSVVNLIDGIPGNNVELDDELRARRFRSLQASGSSTCQAIQSALQQEVENVTDALVIENDTDSTDADGRPMKSVEAMVFGGEHDDIAEKLWEHKPAGIKMFGNTTAIVYDSRGYAHSVDYSRPVETGIWMHVKIVVGPEFTQGAKQKMLITIDTDTDGDYELTINEFTFSYAAFGKTQIEIAAALVADIESGKALADRWSPTTCTDNLDGSFSVECDYKGVPLLFTIDADKMSIETETPLFGDQQQIIENIVTFAETYQLINVDVRRFLYFEPVGDVDNVWGAEIYLGVDPAPVGTANITIPQTGNTSEKALVPSTRITVEIVTSL